MSTNQIKNNINLFIAFCLLIAIAIFGDNAYKETWSQDTRLSGSFVAAVIAFVLYLSFVILSLTAYGKWKSSAMFKLW